MMQHNTIFQTKHVDKSDINTNLTQRERSFEYAVVKNIFVYAYVHIFCLHL